MDEKESSASGRMHGWKLECAVREGREGEAQTRVHFNKLGNIIDAIEIRHPNSAVFL